jgi:hypothetical protein
MFLQEISLRPLKRLLGALMQVSKMSFFSVQRVRESLQRQLG